MIKLAFFFLLGLMLFSLASCSKGDAGLESTPSSQAPKSGVAAKASHLSCSNIDKLSGRCLYTLNMAGNKELLKCVQEYASSGGRNWYLIDQVTSLVCSTVDYKIESLDGIEVLSWLVSLQLRGSDDQSGGLKDVSSLSELGHLQDVRLDHNVITVLPSFSGARNLSLVTLVDNPLKCNQIRSLAANVEFVLGPSHCECLIGLARMGNCSI